MKNLLLITILLTGIFFQSNAQQPLGIMSVSGQVFDSSGNGIANYPVNFRNETFSSKTVFTDVSGSFWDTLNVFGNGNVDVSIIDCFGDSIIYNLTFNGPYDSVYVFFDYCGSGTTNCTGFISQNVNGLNANFTAIDNMPANSQYSWDVNGNTIPGNGSNVSYTFPAAGTYPVCVTATSASCSYAICDIVVVSSTQPGSLELGGNVFKGNSLAQSGLAFLFEFDSTVTAGSTLNAVGFSTLDSDGHPSGCPVHADVRRLPCNAVPWRPGAGGNRSDGPLP